MTSIKSTEQKRMTFIKLRRKRVILLLLYAGYHGPKNDMYATLSPTAGVLTANSLITSNFSIPANRILLASGSWSRSMCFILAIAAFPAYSQLLSPFTPMELHSDRSRALIQDVNSQILDDEIDGGSIRNNFWLQGVQHDQAVLLTRHIKSGAFIRNDSLQAFVDHAMEQIVLTNRLPEKKRIVLIMNTPEVNALCFGQGLFIVTVGLLGRVNNEAELSFILSHELAHDELQHVQKKLQREAEMHTAKETKYAFQKLLSDDISREQVESFRSVLYARSSFNRSKETEADSLGFIYYKATASPLHGVIDAMNTLQTSGDAKHTTNTFFRSLDFTNFPFKPYWIDNRLHVYSQKPGDTFLFSYDSILSHPEIELRKQKLEGYINDQTRDEKEPIDGNGHYNAIAMSEFQTVEAAYQRKQYDLCLFHILQLLNDHPKNAYLVSRAAKLLIDIYEAKNENRLDQFVPRYTREYGKTLLQVNNLLFNISKEEAAEIAFHLLNNQANFNVTDPSHYFLLGEVCDLTLRNQVKKKVEVAYASKFSANLRDYQYK